MLFRSLTKVPGARFLRKRFLTAITLSARKETGMLLVLTTARRILGFLHCRG